MKKIALLMLVFTLFAVTNVYAQKLKNGTYQGGTTGFDGGVSVKVTVYGREIKDISVYVHRGDGWMDDLINGTHPRYPDGMSPNERKDFEENSALLKKEGPRYTSAQDFADAIVKNQSTVIDVMSGATVTCEAVIEAVHEALRSKNRDVVSAWEQEGYQKRLATAQRRNKLKAEERQKIAQAEEAETERKRLEEEAEAERQRLEEEARQQRIAEALKQTPVTPAAGEFKYDLADGTYGGVKIIKYLGTGMCIKIPEKIEGLAVTEIVTDAFDKNTLVKIVIPGTVKNMMSFSGSIGLREVSLEEGIKYIPGSAFKDCRNLKSIKLPIGLQVIEKSAFENSGLESIDIPDSVARIGDAAFRGCKSLQSIKLSSNLKTIEHNTFNSSGLTSIVIPNLIEEIEWYAFSECKSLKSVKLPVSLKRIHHATFYSCSSLSEILIPDTLKNVSFPNSKFEDTFEGCTSLSLAMKSKLREMGYTGNF